IVGAGIIGTRALKKLYSMGHPSLTVCNRSIKKLEEVVTQHDGVKGLPFSSLQSTARTFDIVIVATSSPQHILSNDAFGTDAITSLIIDLSVPRNVNANAASPTRQLVTVEGLKAIAERNVAKRRKEFVKAQLLLDEDIEKIQKWLIHRNTLIQNL
ncbi:hypothetical protein EBR96_09235, partial [bacterium]|nr:hypothetical protein [bacterium]